MAVTETSQVASRALDDLYRQHGRDVYRYALAVLGNHADAEDITQTTFLNAYRALEQGVRPRKPSNWLLTIASNAIKQRFRQEKSRPRQVELDDRLAGTSPDETGPTVGEVLTALSRIPPQQRQAIVLREFEGRSYKELAEILGVTTSALETLLFRARRSLADELEHQLTCTDAQLAISKATDGRIGRKERRRLRRQGSGRRARRVAASSPEASR
jgi:RNA polymerase sigma-70 factor (ECF subfamily)